MGITGPRKCSESCFSIAFASSSVMPQTYTALRSWEECALRRSARSQAYRSSGGRWVLGPESPAERRRRPGAAWSRASDVPSWPGDTPPRCTGDHDEGDGRVGGLRADADGSPYV